MKSQPKLIPGIPEQKKGSFHDTESRRLFENQEETSQAFKILKNRFLSINDWKNFCGKKTEFKLFDSAGNQISRSPQQNDFIRIDIPGPGNPESKGYEWVEIVKISDQFPTAGEVEHLIILCKPSAVPGKNEKNVSHFYSQESSSNFKISRGSKYIKIGIYGRNETPNMNTDFTGKIRNLLIALGGMFGLSKLQWKVFADGILKF